MSDKNIYLALVFSILQIFSISAQDCTASINSIVFSEVDADYVSVSFNLVSQDDFEINLLDENSNTYLINTSNIFPNLSNETVITYTKSSGLVVINNLDKKFMEHRLAIVLIAKDTDCQPLKLELN